jgi:hypothetical protein
MRAFLLFLFLACTAFTQATDPVMPIAESIKDGYNGGNLVSFTKYFNDSLKNQWSKNRFAGYYKNAYIGWGKITSLGQPETREGGVVAIPVKLNLVDATMLLTLDKEGKVAQYDLKENTGIDFSNPKLAAVFSRFPLEGVWKVQEGGDTAELNRHHASTAEAFAMDFIRLPDNPGAPIREKTPNAEDPTYGQRIQSPVAGVVSQVADSVPENTPGQPNTFFPEGNYVAVAYGREFAVFSNLKEKSCLVKLGADVVPGQPLALSGNSGNTSLPVVTFNVRNNFIGQKNSKSLKFGFACVETLDGKTWTPRTNYYPVKGDILRICPEPPKP